MFSTDTYIIFLLIISLLPIGIVIIYRKKAVQEVVLTPTIYPKVNTQFKSKISKPKLVNAIVDWCIQHIGDKQNQPNIQISYHPHRKKYGSYLIDKKLIRIYIKNHKTTESLALTIIHEFVHFVEIKTEKESNNYARFHNHYGYHTNPFERSANEIAAKLYQQCLIDLSAKGYLEAELPLG